ncbi:hypothetical protein LG198_10805 [Methylobacillus arboreus]|uniref:dimethylamine monooxygenase subunit DmmA family protein n=1 Tax=Methylobacillus arboreus TaxID=755170 RepID=UPI001E304339|nr:dimethylamine monooxygenase subunit DmmA family protein [Methylobacillus arboreus]MCB5191217.1 hypothetical protein [Methylobacillus arboreus]
MQHGYWIRSKPIYHSLAWQYKAQAHVLLASGEGGRSVLRLYQQRLPDQPVTVLYLPAENEDYSAPLVTVVGTSLQVFPDARELWQRFDQVLQQSRMGTRLYAAGTESFLWQATTLAVKHGVLNADVMREQPASLARPVYCVHCKTTTHGVTTNIAVCAGCQRHLFVRDHFSRRLGAYMGLMIDAEDPGNVPDAEEVYP